MFINEHGNTVFAPTRGYRTFNEIKRKKVKKIVTFTILVVASCRHFADHCITLTLELDQETLNSKNDVFNKPELPVFVITSTILL